MTGSLGALGACVALLLCAPAASGHIVVGSKSLRVLVAESNLVLRARVLGVRENAGSSTEGPGLQRPEVEAEVLGVWKGSFEAPRIRFVQHGHGVATFEPGREHLLFLVDIDRSRELDALGERTHHEWVSLQEHDDAYLLDGPAREALLLATRAYADAGLASSTEVREAALRTGTLALLGSGDARLAASALRDLVAAPTAPFVTAADLPALTAILDDPNTDVGVRVALLSELERRGLVADEARWLRWLSDEAPTRERVVVIRAAADDPRAAVRARLVELLATRQAEVAAAAAIALGRPGDASVVPALENALNHPSSRVRNAVIRGLGKTRTPEAILVLVQAGETHPDPVTRRLAAAEARKRTSGRSPS